MPPPAPGELGIVQAFVNTEDRKANTDVLKGPGQLGDWLTQWNLLFWDTEITQEDLERVLAARAGVRALVEAHHGYPMDEKAVEKLDHAIRGAGPQMRFHRDGRARFESESFDDALGHLVSLVVMTRLAGQWDRLKVCANDGCRALFYDSSNKSTSKWCTRRCGDLIRARAYRRGQRY